MKINPNTPIWQLTVGEFMELCDSIQQPTQPNDFTGSVEKRYVYGLNGIAQLFGCSKRHAHTLKSSGMLDKAIIQTGRKIIVDAELALELVKKSKN